MKSHAFGVFFLVLYFKCTAPLDRLCLWKLCKFSKVSEKRSGFHYSWKSALPVSTLWWKLKLLCMQGFFRSTPFHGKQIQYQEAEEKLHSPSICCFVLTTFAWQFCIEIRKMLRFHMLKSKNGSSRKKYSCIKTKQHYFFPHHPPTVKSAVVWNSIGSTGTFPKPKWEK